MFYLKVFIDVLHFCKTKYSIRKYDEWIHYNTELTLLIWRYYILCFKLHIRSDPGMNSENIFARVHNVISNLWYSRILCGRRITQVKSGLTTKSKLWASCRHPFPISLSKQICLLYDKKSSSLFMNAAKFLMNCRYWHMQEN